MKPVQFIASHRVPDDDLVHGVAGARYSTPHRHIAVSLNTLCGIHRGDYTPVEEPINCLACLAVPVRTRPEP